MKRIAIFMSRLKYGGMELSLINFINNSGIANDNSVDLYLAYVINEELLKKIDKRVSIHLLCKGKWNLINKFIVLGKFCFLYLFHKKYDVSICYSNHQKILSVISRRFSKNNILFVHSDLYRYKETNEVEKIKKKISFNNFNKIVCVSEIVKNALVDFYGHEIEKKCYIIPNYVDGDEIIKKAKEEPKRKFDYSIPTFVNIANHVEKYKNIVEIINAADKLNREGIKFQILLIGDGEDSSLYKTMIKEKNLKNVVYLLGNLANPYPYLIQSRALLFTSKYEGYGMVLDEARVLGVPIISTGSGASKEICLDGYGIVTNDVYSEIKKMVNKEKLKKNFDFIKHNNAITAKIDLLLNGK